MQSPELILETTAYTIEQLAASDISQLAFVGRSNVGKSSLINALAGRRNLAKVSSTPGKTRSVNYYRVNPGRFYLVDLPGYGYAKANHIEREKWKKLLERYLKECRQLHALVLLLDSRLTPQKIDKELVEYANSIGLNLLPVLTKADKCRNREVAMAINAWEKFIGSRPIVTSARSKYGILELWQAIFKKMGISAQTSIVSFSEDDGIPLVTEQEGTTDAR